MTGGLTLFVGDISEHTAQAAVAHDPTAFLIDQSNYQIAVDHPAVAYTSLGDLPDDLALVYQLFDRADQLVYVPLQAEWSDHKSVDVTHPTQSMQGLTEFVLSIFAKEKSNVKNLNLSAYSIDKYTKLASDRKTSDPQLWIAGCSTSHATGVNDNQRYGHLVADRLGLSASFLTCPGSSIQWAADQILRSDIKANDIVLWGLTDESRFPLWSEENKVIHVHANQLEQQQSINHLSSNIVAHLLVDPTNLYQAVIHVQQVVNFCKKIQAKLLILGLNVSDTLSLHLQVVPEFVKFVNKISNSRYIDLGTDNQHPGPQQHQAFADICINQLKSLNYI
jgi:hypothetical protein